MEQQQNSEEMVDTSGLDTDSNVDVEQQNHETLKIDDTDTKGVLEDSEDGSDEVEY